MVRGNMFLLNHNSSISTNLDYLHTEHRTLCHGKSFQKMENWIFLMLAGQKLSVVTFISLAHVQQEEEFYFLHRNTKQRHKDKLVEGKYLAVYTSLRSVCLSSQDM